MAVARFQKEGSASGGGRLNGISSGEERINMSSVADYQARVRELGCVVCMAHENIHNTVFLQLHHVESVRDGLSEYAVVPLCASHHQGPNGVHGLGRRGFQARYKLTDVDLLALVARELSK